MTTVETPGPQYPVTPPWVSTPPPAEPVSPAPPVRHNQLLVRFPGEVHGAARPEAPSWQPVVAWTFFLSAIGVVSAMRRARRARSYGRARAPYWIAFLTTLVAGAVFWSVLVFDVALPTYQRQKESAATEAVEAKVLSDGRVEEAVGTTVKSAWCIADGDRRSDGLRTYDCSFKLGDGRTASMRIDADTRGNWETTD
ncbi:hypothetical protein [Actinoplanes sp. NPDC051851]|uniref:hypothetical protein n=1 Tax=Actinoplanes sp. NPDC051851 TaxID=3154753 RepID=UPI0034455E3E